MHIALCTPISIDLFDKDVEHSEPLPKGYTYALAYYLCRLLLSQGHRVTVVTTAFDVLSQTEWTNRAETLRIIAVPRRRPRFTILDAYRKEVRSMRRALQAASPDIVHAQWTYEFADAGLSTGIPCVVTARDAPWRVAWEFRHIYRWYRAFYESLWIAPRIKYLTVVSPHIAAEFAKEPLFHPIKQWVVPNGLDSRLITAESDFCISRSEAPIILAVNAWNHLKNPIALFAAYQIVRRKMPKARLVVFGMDAQGKGGKLEELARAKGVLAGVEFQGTRPYNEMLEYLEREADIVVHTTREESFSMVALEAMAKGVPCVAGNRSGGVPWVLGDGTAGVLVDIESPESIAAGVLRLIENPDCYAQIARMGVERVKTFFTLERIVQEYIAVYEEVLAKSQIEKEV